MTVQVPAELAWGPDSDAQQHVNTGLSAVWSVAPGLRMVRSLKLIASQSNISSRANECLSKNKMEIREAAKWLRANSDLPEGLSSIPGTHIRWLTAA